MGRYSGIVPGLCVVVAAMVVLFVVPAQYFAPATFLATGCMLGAAYFLGAIRRPSGTSFRSLSLGLATAILLYMAFYAGGAFVDAYHPFGMSSASEASIYALIASPSNPLYLQVSLLLFDSAGYEAFFRGVLQSRLQPRMGVAAAPAVALLDASLHLITLNPVWVAGTFLTDLVWGLTYHYGRGLQGSFLSHIAWDLAIFVVRPVT